MTACRGDTTACCGDTTACHGDTTACRGDTTACHGDTTACYGDTSACHGDTAACHGDTALSSIGDTPSERLTLVASAASIRPPRSSLARQPLRISFCRADSWRPGPSFSTRSRRRTRATSWSTSPRFGASDAGDRTPRRQIRARLVSRRLPAAARESPASAATPKDAPPARPAKRSKTSG